MTTNALHLRCSQCLAETDNTDWMQIYADTIYRGFALCIMHFRKFRDADEQKAASARSQQM